MKTFRVNWAGNILFSYEPTPNLQTTDLLFLIPSENSLHYIEFIYHPSHDTQQWAKMAYRSMNTGKAVLGFGSGFAIPASTFRAAYIHQSKILVVVEGKNTLAGYRINVRKALWKLTFNSTIQCPPVSSKQSIVYTCLQNGTLHAISTTGKILWKKLVDITKIDSQLGTSSCPVGPKGNVYLVALGHIWAYSSSGKHLWTSEILANIDTPPNITANGELWFGRYGTLHSLSASGKISKIKLRTSTNRLPHSPLSLQSGSLLLTDLSYISQISSKGVVLQKFTDPGIIQPFSRISPSPHILLTRENMK